ncbi:MAG TPA: tRNA pseudouridine(38-40) synthase TruA [Thermoanaerobaculia bacterium]|nr:tRNA pseudouridine(38-40) synthase TruA [Thermoanaerobaculia bacterium]
MVYRLILSYRGDRYAGWQRQVNAVAVQEVVEGALASLLGEEIGLTAASRTDAGVHARGQVAHLHLDRTFPPRGFVYGTNRRLPEDVRVLSAALMPDDFHARYSARSKEYRYRLTRAEVLSPLDSLFSVRVQNDVELEPMVRAAGLLVGEHDFSAFALAGGAHRSSVRRIDKAQWESDDGRLTFCIEGSGFLRGMVRSLVGTLIRVGRGRMQYDEFAALLAGGRRSQAGPTAPAQGLTLERVFYEPPFDV